MNYIGSKHKLAGFIRSTVEEVMGLDLTGKVFCDLFAGTGIVGRSFKPLVKKVLANDIEYYSYALLKNYIGNNRELNFKERIEELNNLPGREGFIFKHYAEGGEEGRLYFSAENARKIDAARIKLEDWRETSVIEEDLYYFLLASVIESADKVANTASVYGAYLKKLKPSAIKDLQILPAHFEIAGDGHKVYREDANDLIERIEGDILYLDPPYNARQYGANYHLLNTIAKYDTFVPKGKTGLRDYYKSSYCRTGEVRDSFENLIRSANFSYIFLSYNNEGLMPAEEIKKIMQQYGKYDLVTKDYQRFKADKTENRNHTATATTEYLHILEKNQ
ncbi:modification methylase [Antarcticibacterium flavum]|uniref:site-specific DNA-methyltransferase (adenine-specific) n=1 Tax=Antarcticibacterium flavum TaxID=2058175 RepID=A0A5B7X221_9FLAO|nr:MULTISPECIES: DNA adenine methylase [Antarcticibacterium]MCM4159196.1 modification methylase [Antarcticibacterium sp. W02-3]QCY69594.1 modification methylase [Antarcticibacterium flavum]